MIGPYLFLLLVASRFVAGFRPVRQIDLLSSTTNNRLASSTQDNPFREVDLDLDKARDCANHFGKYPKNEVEKMRDDLHAHRIQSMVMADPVPTAPEEIFEEKALEDELNLQLNLLQEEFPDPYMFPQTLESDEMAELPHMKDGTPADTLEEEQQLAWWEEMAEEGVLESIAICSIIGFLMMGPNLL